MQLRPENLEKYVNRARNKLIEIASRGETITYSELMREIGGPGWGYIGQVLKGVCGGEHRQNRPLLGSVVVRAKVKHPGDGYWQSSPTLESISYASKKQRLEFWQKERGKVYEYWQKYNAEAQPLLHSEKWEVDLRRQISQNRGEQ